MTTFNVLIHSSAHYYKYYTAAFLFTHFKNVQVYEESNLPPNTTIHCIFIYMVSFDEIKKYLNPYTKIIFITGEAHDIHLPFLHFIIDCKNTSPQKAPSIHLPFYVQCMCERLAHPRELLIERQFDAKSVMTQKTKFCAYMYSNPVEFRDKFFHTLARVYKSADALGSCCSKQTRGQTTRMLYEPLVKTYLEDAVEKYKPYKFVIAIENSRINGYITEKLMNPTLARAVPIYLGAPDVFRDGVFNRKAIIHIDDFPTYEKCVEHIKKVDETPELYLQYLQEPLFTGNQLPIYFDSDYILQAFLSVFGQ